MSGTGAPSVRITRRGRLVVTLSVASLVGGAALLTGVISAAGPAPTNGEPAAKNAVHSAADVDARPADTAPSVSSLSPPEPAPEQEPGPEPVPEPVPVPEDVVSQAASGVMETVPGTQGPADGAGRVVRYRVLVEQGLAVDGTPVDGAAFAQVVHSVLTDARGWEPIDGVRFARVDSDTVDVEVALASPATTDAMCAPLGTGGWLSCFNGSATVLNARRWFAGVQSYGDDLLNYRTYLVSHEMGHYLGHQHVECPAAGTVAPVMVQQTKSLQGCTKGPWPSGSR